MVEQIVAFTLGFCICGLIGLAFLPLVSGRARRLTLLRIEERLPMTFEEIEADRDLLRARFAVEKCALEIKAQEARDARAGDAAELGRRAVALTRINEQLDQANALLRERGEQLARALQFGEATKTELAGVSATLAAREEDLRAKQAELDALAEAHRQLEKRAGDLDSGFAATTEELRAVRARLEAAEVAQRDLAVQAETASGEVARLQAALQEAESRNAAAAQDEADMSALRAAISRIGQDMARLDARE